MEYEVRFYYNSNELENIISKLKSIKELKQKPRTYEKTIQYDDFILEDNVYKISAVIKYSDFSFNKLSPCSNYYLF